MSDNLNRPKEDKLLKDLYDVAVKYHNTEQPTGDAPDYFSEARPLLRQYISDGINEVFEEIEDELFGGSSNA